MIQEGDYLRIVTPVRNSRGECIFSEDGRKEVKETTAPLQARRNFEAENDELERAGRPDLKHKIMIVRAEPLLQSFADPIAPALDTDVKPVKPKPLQAKPKIDEDDIFQ